ncbi:Zinc phosphodiesterase ELAC protein 1 [Phytophthora boehmeriae]|uniref:Zinc phosphodiesterase ELAC protein 1 n=1 Tax=Phytophthora boehmeriae TaxID=109152 RepID=A0A8T1X462_9STRA|nr:Zinc phosphodiesterase ELAC protein 1 [Phytophthora boehmeriae]
MATSAGKVATAAWRRAPLSRILERHALLCSVPKRSCNTLFVKSQQKSFSGFELLFLGTSAGSPSVRRNPTGVCLRLARSNWMFDCAEGSLRQLMKSTVRVPLTTKFFISHLHGDHLYGLPGILCTLDNHNAEYKDPVTKENAARRIDVYGPLGLFSYLNTAFSTCSTRLTNLQVTVHELVNSDLLSEMTVYEKFMRNAPVHPSLTREWIHAQSDGNGDVTGPKALGRKVAILGDSADSSRMFDIAQNCDILVHEATLSHRMVKQAVHRGHSTARMAGYAAKKMNAKILALTHFSHRFRHWSVDAGNCRTTLHLALEAQESFGKRAVVPASDFLRIPVPRPPHE